MSCPNPGPLHTTHSRGLHTLTQHSTRQRPDQSTLPCIHISDHRDTDIQKSRVAEDTVLEFLLVLDFFLYLVVLGLGHLPFRLRCSYRSFPESNSGSNGLCLRLSNYGFRGSHG